MAFRLLGLGFKVLGRADRDEGFGPLGVRVIANHTLCDSVAHSLCNRSRVYCAFCCLASVAGPKSMKCVPIPQASSM